MSLTLKRISTLLLNSIIDSQLNNYKQQYYSIKKFKSK